MTEGDVNDKPVAEESTIVGMEAEEEEEELDDWQEQEQEASLHEDTTRKTRPTHNTPHTLLILYGTLHPSNQGTEIIC